MSNSLWPHDRPPCPSPTPGAYPNSCPLSRWCHPTISSSVIPFSSCPQSCPSSASFQMSQLFPSGGQSTGDSASVLPMNTQDWSPLGWTGSISLPYTFKCSPVPSCLILLQTLCSRHLSELQLQHQSFRRIPRKDFLWDGLVGSPRHSKESSPAPQL